MIKAKAFSTFIICSILISGISNSFVLGMETVDDLEKDKRSTRSLSNEEKQLLIKKPKQKSRCCKPDCLLAFLGYGVYAICWSAAAASVIAAIVITSNKHTSE